MTAFETREARREAPPVVPCGLDEPHGPHTYRALRVLSGTWVDLLCAGVGA